MNGAATTLRAEDLRPEACYKLLTGLVVPRPIAWITTRSADGLVNLAPFSCYTFVCSDPPMLGVNIGLRDGTLKDTARNIRDAREFVVNVGSEPMLPAIHRSADEFAPSESETALLGLALADSEVVATPRLRDVPASMECRLHSVQEYGHARAQFIVGEVLRFHFREGVCVDGKVDVAKLNPVGRIGGLQYCRVDSFISMPPIRRAAQRAAPRVVEEGGR
ncbi:MAG: flavin reductase family protein [Burkholderiales bacterium]